VTGLVCDTGAIGALATGSTLHARDLLQTAVAEGITLAVPAAAYATAWAGSAPLSRMLLDSFLDLAVVVVDPLDAQTARATAVVLTRAGARESLDFAQVVVSAQARGWPVISTASEPLFALAPDLAMETLP
jgi:hypothetical protein